MSGTAGRFDDAIAAIDGALEDWGVGPDAMRWAPPPPTLEQRVLLMETADYGGAVVAAGRLMTEFLRAWVEEAVRVLSESVDWTAVLDGAATLGMADAGPDDPRDRALWLRRTRNTGPSRLVQDSARPRAHR